MTNYTNEELMAIWRSKNDTGLGFSVGAIDETPDVAAYSAGYRVVREISPDGCVLAANDHELIVVCDCNGPWAVRISEE